MVDMIDAPRPWCNVHGIHHPPGNTCSISEDDQKAYDAYKEAVLKELDENPPTYVYMQMELPYE